MRPEQLVLPAQLARRVLQVQQARPEPQALRGRPARLGQPGQRELVQQGLPGPSERQVQLGLVLELLGQRVLPGRLDRRGQQGLQDQLGQQALQERPGLRERQAQQVLRGRPVLRVAADQPAQQAILGTLDRRGQWASLAQQERLDRRGQQD